MASLDEWESLLSIYAEYPLKELIIHPRLQKEFYNGTPHTEAFRLAQDAITAPLCYNGDITSRDPFAKLTTQLSPASFHEHGTPCDTIMLGRGALGNPLLPALLRDETISNTKDLKIFQAFHDEILNGYIELMSGDQPVLFRMKELWVYMRNFIDLSDKQVKKIQKAKSLTEYKIAVREVL